VIAHEKGLLTPVHFLPKVENTHVMTAVDKWVIDQALLQLKQWHDEGKDWSVSINIDANYFMQESFVDDLKQALNKYPSVLTHWLEIEILETIALNDLAYVSKLIRECQALGVSFALDDFGTGYSSLAYLKSLPTEWLKIDQSFVRDMFDDDEDLALIEAIMSLSKGFNRQVIAEGVETVEQGVALLELGCEHAQGYVIAKPMPAEDVVDWAQSFAPGSSWSAFNKLYN
jgi:EAL domain-containing protein (putative c-di-GMP-specific phosphodiesterase class I)